MALPSPTILLIVFFGLLVHLYALYTVVNLSGVFAEWKRDELD
jgi:hypothetical protein